MDEVEQTVHAIKRDLFEILLQIQDDKYGVRLPDDEPVSEELLQIHWATMHRCVGRLGMMVELGSRGGWDTVNGAEVCYQRLDELETRVRERLLEQSLDLLLDMALIGLSACALLQIEAYTASPHWNEFANLRDADERLGTG